MITILYHEETGEIDPLSVEGIVGGGEHWCELHVDALPEGFTVAGWRVIDGVLKQF